MKGVCPALTGASGLSSASATMSWSSARKWPTRAPISSTAAAAAAAEAARGQQQRTTQHTFHVRHRTSRKCRTRTRSPTVVRVVVRPPCATKCGECASTADTLLHAADGVHRTGRPSGCPSGALWVPSGCLLGVRAGVRCRCAALTRGITEAAGQPPSTRAADRGAARRRRPAAVAAAAGPEGHAPASAASAAPRPDRDLRRRITSDSWMAITWHFQPMDRSSSGARACARTGVPVCMYRPARTRWHAHAHTRTCSASSLCASSRAASSGSSSPDLPPPSTPLHVPPPPAPLPAPLAPGPDMRADAPLPSPPAAGRDSSRRATATAAAAAAAPTPASPPLSLAAPPPSTLPPAPATCCKCGCEPEGAAPKMDVPSPPSARATTSPLSSFCALARSSYGGGWWRLASVSGGWR
jgi:hypothetical protein